MSLIEKWKKHGGLFILGDVKMPQIPVHVVEADLRKVIDELKPNSSWKNPDKLDGYIMALTDIEQKIFGDEK